MAILLHGMVKVVQKPLAFVLHLMILVIEMYIWAHSSVGRIGPFPKCGADLIFRG